jgi:hypothetical protein
MATKKRPVKKAVKKKAVKKTQTKMAPPKDLLLATVKGATHRYLGHVRLDVGPAGAARVKRIRGRVHRRAPGSTNRRHRAGT